MHILRWQDSSVGFKTNPAISIRRQGAAGTKVSFSASKSALLSLLVSQPKSLWTLRVYTDARSPNVQSLWRLNWQLRVSALASVEVEGEQVNAAWERVRQSHASADYLSALPPGHVQSGTPASAANSADSVQGHHLAVLTFKVTAMDWLVLSKDGHRRARLTPAGRLDWLVP